MNEITMLLIATFFCGTIAAVAIHRGVDGMALLHRSALLTWRLSTLWVSKWWLLFIIPWPPLLLSKIKIITQMVSPAPDTADEEEKVKHGLTVIGSLTVPFLVSAVLFVILSNLTRDQNSLIAPGESTGRVVCVP